MRWYLIVAVLLAAHPLTTEAQRITRIPPASTSDAVADELPKDIQAAFAKGEIERLQKVSELKARIGKARQYLRENPRAKDLADWKTGLKSDMLDLAQLESEKDLHIPELTLGADRGEIGTMLNVPFVVFRIYDEKNLIVTIGDMTLFISDVRTDGLVDGDWVECSGAVRIIGPKRIGTVTIREIRTFDINPFRKLAEKQIAEKKK